MTPSALSQSGAVLAGGWRVSGKSFRDGAGQKVFLNGVTYGPFEAEGGEGPWPEEEQMRRDFDHIARLGFNVVRVYEVPTDVVLAAAVDFGLRLLSGVPWTQHVDFMADVEVRGGALSRVREEAGRLAGQPAVAGLIVGNEIEKTLVRWMGPERVRDFLEEMIAAARTEAPELPIAYASYPSTEYLVPRNASFVGFNVFLEDPVAFAAYLQRLQNVAGDKPLVITEFGLDTKKNGESAQAETMRWQRESLLRAGVAGNFWFSYTDEWHRGGEEVTGWDFGLVTRDRRPKLACSFAAGLPTRPDVSSGSSTPFISVIVCTRNGALTLSACMDAVSRQSHPAYEVLVIDDGSTDATSEIVKAFPFAQYHRQHHAGLSAARNLGMKLAKGEILAYTDDDAIPDEDWLVQLATAYDDPGWVAAGGPNIPPTPRTLTEEVVAMAPGAPTHVLLNDVEAEHLPGCNLSIRKSALEAIGGFREEFRAAGDDVDVCWRLQAAGGKLRFVPAAVVWHHRRSTVAGYLRQQLGYGRAEALLIARFAERFAWFGGARWSGAIYGNPVVADLDGVQFGRHGLAPFQCIYSRGKVHPMGALVGLPWFAGTIAVLVLAACTFSFAAMLVVPGMIVAATLVSLNEMRRRVAATPTFSWKQRSMLWLLCWLQPIVRDAARVQGMIASRAWPRAKLSKSWSDLGSRAFKPLIPWSRLEFWGESGVGREALLETMQRCSHSHGVEWQEAPDRSEYDAELRCRGASFGLKTVTEYHGRGGGLTAVRFGSLADARLGIMAALGLALLLTSELFVQQEPVRVLIGFALIIWSAICLRGRLICLALIRQLAIVAAKECGLKIPFGQGATDAAAMPGQALAVSREPVEVCLEET